MERERQILTGLVAHCFILLLAIGNMCKAMCGVAAGACGGAINLHWAKGSDISDINAKFGAQHTVTGALGLVFAAFFARSVSTLSQTKLWILYSSLTLLHIIANMQCMKLIAFDSLNDARMNLIVKEFLENNVLDPPSDQCNATFMGKPVKLSSPQVIARAEPLFFIGTQPSKVAPLPVHLGVSLDEFAAQTDRSDLEVLLQQASQNDNYLLATASHHGRQPTVVVSFLSCASPEDHAKAYYHAVLLTRQLKAQGPKVTDADILFAEAMANEELDRSWGKFAQACEVSGWDLSKTELRSHGYELELIENK